MKISLDWLSDFIDITENDHQKIKDIITERSAEIETMESQGDDLDLVVVGKVLEVGKHPNADSLQLCKVNDGQETVQVVCGGSNVKEGMLCAFAKLGAVVRWHGSEVVKMEKAKIRGEESFGMICASDEIGLADMFPKQSEKEIVDLSHLNLKVGQPLAKALGLDDVVIDVDNHAITNRSDLFSQRGFAREFVACGLAKWKKQKEYSLPEGGSEAPVELTIQDKDACSHYVGVYLTDVEVKDSPEWVKKRLSACGVNPISNMVDITNFVMLEMGMPLHAFDLDRTKSRKWTMRKSKKGEKLVTLDETEYELPEDAIVLDDGHSLIDLCGIQGGLTSGIYADTNKVWLIAPVYNPTLIRRGMRSIGHITDASIIYEKGVDPALAYDGLARALELVKELCPTAKIASKVMDIWNIKQEKRELDLRASRIEKLVGVEIPTKEVEKILADLGFTAKSAKDGWKVEIPTFRMNDVKMEADLIEEVARVYGYNNVPYKTPVKELTPVVPSAISRLSKAIKNELTGFGFNEICTFSFLGPELLQKCGMEVADEMIELANPLSGDLSLMRTTLLPWTMQTIADNLRYQGTVKLFELSKVYHRKSNTEYNEEPHLIMATAGEDFRVLQGVVEHFGYTLMPSKDKAVNHHPGRCADIVIRGKAVGQVYEIHPQILKNFDIKPRVTVAEINLQMILDMNIDTRVKYQELPKYPSVQLDISLVVPKKDLAGDYEKTIAKTDQKLIKTVELIDEYTGDKISADQRGLTYSITYQAADKTLTDQEVEAVHKQVLERLKKNGAEIR
jgi:phenylalanyl-tRNA synthetase beta chain